MKSEWKKLTVGDLCSHVYSGATPNTKHEEYYIGGVIPWLNTSEIKFNRIYSTGKYITELGLSSSSAKWVPVNAVIVAMYGATAAKVSFSKIPLTTNQACCNLIINNNKADYRYVYYWLYSKYIELQSLANGGAQQNLNARQIKEFPIIVPPFDIQQKIAGILSLLDDKIELNNRINENLEAQAQTIFTQEFLSFDSIPEGWQESSLLEIANYLNGLAMQKNRPKKDEQGLPVLKIKELRQGFCDSNSELCSPSIRQDYIIHDGDVIFSWSGSLLGDFWCGGVCGLNQHLFKVTSSIYDKWFYYVWTKHHLQKFATIAADMATTMGHIKREELSKAEVLIPTQSDYERIGALLSPIYELIISNRIENRKLAEIRDTLLPRLMSGELDVSDLDI